MTAFYFCSTANLFAEAIAARIPRFSRTARTFTRVAFGSRRTAAMYRPCSRQAACCAGEGSSSPLPPAARSSRRSAAWEQPQPLGAEAFQLLADLSDQLLAPLERSGDLRDSDFASSDQPPERCDRLITSQDRELSTSRHTYPSAGGG